ncbi:hypothetical protein [Faucicola boevrei]|uniref:hypothetical protein n=1 Tax=Faucicola boevrei TaxID=346665 RepID=UPI00036820E5|nr:hypothetical protein [Moraxella boevrei]
MATSSFFKSFVVTDEKAIEQFLYDLENAKPKPMPPKQEQPSVDKMLKILEKRLANQSQKLNLSDTMKKVKQ